MDLSAKQSKIIIVLAAGVLFLPFLGSVNLFDWDEINFAECAREMVVTRDWGIVQLNYKPFWEKPPLFIWLSAASMSCFGVNEFAARFPNALCGMLTLLVLFNAGTRQGSKKLGMAWVLCYVGSTLPQFYFHSGIIDPWFNLFIFCAVDQFARNCFHYSAKRIFFAGLLLGLALLTKGPAAIVIFLLAALTFFAIHRPFKPKLLLHAFLSLSIALLTGGSWFLMLALSGRMEVITHFISYQVHLFNAEDSGHGGPIYYHLIVLLIGCFPISALALVSFNKSNARTEFGVYHKWMLALFIVVLVVFSIVKTKIVHYSSLCYYPLSFFAAIELLKMREGRSHWNIWTRLLLFISGGFISVALIAIPLIDIYKAALIKSGIIHDAFARANLLAQVRWLGFEWLPGVLLLVFIVYYVFVCPKEKEGRLMSWLLAGNALLIPLTCILIVPKVEAYIQRAAIDFYKAKSKEDCYVSAISYHSYAHYYYALRKPESDPQRLTTDWMIYGELDKPAYFVTKLNVLESVKAQYPGLVQIGEKNGYVFFKRNASKD